VNRSDDDFSDFRANFFFGHPPPSSRAPRCTAGLSFVPNSSARRDSNVHLHCQLEATNRSSTGPIRDQMPCRMAESSALLTLLLSTWTPPGLATTVLRGQRSSHDQLQPGSEPASFNAVCEAAMCLSVFNLACVLASAVQPCIMLQCTHLCYADKP